jgi:hypothetical protein
VTDDDRALDNFSSMFLVHFSCRETEQYAKREEVWREIEELARKNNPQFENLINHMEFLSISNQNNNNDYTLNEDDFSSDKFDQYSKDVRRIF